MKAKATDLLEVTKLIAFGYLLSQTLISAASAQDAVYPIFTMPECTAKTYKEPIFAVNGSVILEKTTEGAFCNTEDFPEEFDIFSSRVGGAIREELSQNLKSVRMAMYIFSDISIAQEFCEAYARHPFKFEIFSQNRQTETASAVGIHPPVMDLLKKCMPNDLSITLIGCDVWGSERCPDKDFNTMHMKLLEFEKEDGTRTVVFGSGNIGRGIYSNLEDWVFLYGANPDIHKCVWETLQKVSKNYTENDLLYNDCESELFSPNGYDDLQNLIFLPFEAEEYYQEFYKRASSSKHISISSMDFKDRRLAGALRSALRKGAFVTFFVSSDWYYASRAKVSVGNAKRNELEIANNLLEEFSNSVEVRFVDVNFFSSKSRNNLHHKFVVFEEGEGKSSVMTGTVNMSPGAIRNNLDQAYIIIGDAADEYIEYLDWLRKISSLYADMPVKLPVIAGVE